MKTVSSGKYFNLGLKTSGQVWGWQNPGLNGESFYNINWPRIDNQNLSGLTDTTPTQFSQRSGYYTELGYSGQAENPSRHLFTKIMMGNFLSSNIGVALTVDGHMYCWGDNTYGQLGSNLPYADGTKYTSQTSNTLIKANYNGFHVGTIDSNTSKAQKLWIKKDTAGNPIKFTDVSVGGNHILAIEKDTGWVFGWEIIFLDKLVNLILHEQIFHTEA